MKTEDFVPYDRDAVISRVTILVRRAMNDGVGWFLLALSLLTVSALAAHVTLVGLEEYHVALEKRIVKGMQTSLEPRFDQLEHGAVAFVLSPLNGNPPSAAVSPAFDFLKTTLTSLLQESLAVHEPVLPRALQMPRSQSTGLQSSDDHWSGRTRWEQDTLRHMENFRVRKGVPFIPCPYDARKSYRRYQRDFGPMGCTPRAKEAETNFTVVVPALRSIGGGETLAYSARINDAGRGGVLLEDAVDLLLAQQASDAVLENFTHVVQAYMISLDDVLAFWRREPFRTEELFDEPLRIWSAGHYVQTFLTDSTRKHYPSFAYVDYGKYGLVRTECGNIELPLDRTRATARGTTLFGVLCADYLVDQKEILQYAAESPMLDILYVLPTSSTIRFADLDTFALFRPLQPSSITGPPTIDHHVGWELIESTAQRKMEIGRALHQAVQDNGQQKLEREVVPVPSLQQATFSIPLSQRGLLLIVPKPPRVPAYVAVALVVAIFCMALAALPASMGADRATRASRLDSRLMLLRNLQVGVVVADEDDTIEEVNDRAEELLGMILPKTGERALWKFTPHRFETLIDPYVVESQPMRVARYRDVIPAKRRRGEHSSYYALLSLGSRKGSWIRVSASPIIFEGKGRDEPRTFAIIEDVDTETVTQLAREWSQHRGEAA